LDPKTPFSHLNISPNYTLYFLSTLIPDKEELMLEIYSALLELWDLILNTNLFSDFFKKFMITLTAMPSILKDF
jgi:hypothetical protein